MATWWRLCVCSLGILLLVPSSLSEKFSLAGSPNPVVGVVGQDVVLPCQLSPPVQLPSIDVWWRKIGTEIIPVHEYTNNGTQDLPGEGYQTRTELFPQEFSSGNVSLKLKRLQVSDDGTYQCIVRIPEGSLEATTELQVAGDVFPRVSPWLAAFWVMFALVLVTAGVCAYLGFSAKRKASQKEYSKDEIQLNRDDEANTSEAGQQEQKQLLDELKVELNELKVELKWRWARNYADEITLNADTAHPNLSIAGEKKSLKHEAQPQKVQPNPERFDSTVCVLGSEGFSDGKHYWEVDVMSSSDWDLGVARKSIERKGKLSLSPKEGFWALGLNGRDYWAKADPWTRVIVQKKPKKIGIYLSYEEKQVTFFNVTDMSVLFTFNDCSFSEEVYPFFKNSHKETTMRISSIKDE